MCKLCIVTGRISSKKAQMDAINLSDICQQTIAIAKQAGSFIAGQAKDFDQGKVEFKAETDLVSYVDKEAERMIVDGLRQVLPGAGFIAEEGTGEAVPSGYNWIIDPLDGTTNFIHSIPMFSVSIALADQTGEPVVGVVYDIMHQQCFHAVKGGGAFLDANLIKVSPRERFVDSVIAVGTPVIHDHENDPTLGMLQKLITGTRGVRRLGSAALDLCYVACGRYDAFFEYNLKPWDVAAGTLITREAGGVVTAFHDNRNPIYDFEMVAGSPKVHPVMLGMVQKVLEG
jgi:myo-inositol-1(or 4)-monophosphatase